MIVIRLGRRNTLPTPADHTFVVCAYGESPYLEECLASLRSQTITTNIILSTSTSNELIKRVCDKYEVPLHINPGPGGIAGDWNFAVSLASTPLVTIAHQDDVYLDRYVEVMLTFLSNRSDATLFFSDYAELRQGVCVDKNKLLDVKRALLLPLKSKTLSKSKFVRRRTLSLGCPICCPSVTLVKSAFTEPLFDVHFGSNLDWQTWEKLAAVPGSFVYAPEILMMHRIHADSETSHLIENDSRTQEDLEMLSHFWPMPIARLINRVYAGGQKGNSTN